MDRKKILLVDDDPNILKPMSVRLKGAGYDVVVAMDGLQGVMMAHKQNPDLIVLDIRMPGGGGISVLDKLKASIKTKGIPVVVASAYDDHETREKVKELGARKFFKKPFELEDLLKAIREILGEEKPVELEKKTREAKVGYL